MSEKNLSFAEAQKSRRIRRVVADTGRNWECPLCGSDDFSVERTIPDSKGIYRRRECKCGAVIETHETIINIIPP